jgi:small-conductance mechanosensitive channel/CRP-like cAMP-binding protein
VSNLVLAGVVTAAASLAAYAIVPGRYVRARLKFTLWLLLAFFALEAAWSNGAGDVDLLSALARLVFVLAAVNLSIALLINPWRSDRPSERVPAIVQDVMMIVLFTVIGTVLMREQLLATSAVGAVVIGFALQDTLGNLFAGLAIQIEKPFSVGHWIAVAGNEGQVQEVTWRATKLRTKAGQFLIVPNSVISKESILNYSEPTVPTRVEVEVGVSYQTPPNEAKRAIREALANAPLVMREPQPQVVLQSFGSSAIDYRVQFWIEDYSVDTPARDQVRTNIWYSFRRRNIEIPWPIQIQYERDEEPVRTSVHIAAAADRLASVDLFGPLSPEQRLSLSQAADEHLFAAGEAVVRQGDSGDSMFIVLDGRVRVLIEPSGQEVAVIGPGGFFGEMSMLTGDARTATVRAIEDSHVLEIEAEDIRHLAIVHPTLIEHITSVVAQRRAGLSEAQSSAATSGSAQTRRTLLTRIQKFLRLPVH